MRTFWASGGGGSRRSKGLPIEARGVGGPGEVLRRSHRLPRLQLLFSVLFFGVLAVFPAMSESVTLTWDVAEPGAAGHRVYLGSASRDYQLVFDVGSATSCALPADLLGGTPYFFAVTAYSHFGVESDFSPEVVYAPALPITSLFTDDYGTVLTWASEPGRFYRVLTTPTLTDPVWVDVSGPLLATSTTRLWIHIRTTSVRLFYRVELVLGVR
jgi:hypothetical protein